MKCLYCDYETDKAPTLRKHNSRIHPDKKVRKPLPKVRCTKRKLYLGKKRLNYNNEKIYRKYLTEQLIADKDGLCPGTERNSTDLFDVLKGTLRLCCPDNVYHLICLDPTLLKDIQQVKEVIPVQCKCFCNLLKDDDNPIEYIKNVLDNMEQYYHYHCLVILHEGHTERSVQMHFSAVYGNNQYRLLKINDVNHYINAFLYISGRESSKKINTHIEQSAGYYLRPHQKANIYRQLAPMLPRPITEESIVKFDKFKSSQEQYTGHISGTCSLSNKDFCEVSALRAMYNFDI